MTLQTALIAILVLLLGTAQYALASQALLDLRDRARVRGDSKVLWALCILCVPFGGPIVYNWMGPTSFRARPTTMLPPIELDHAPANVTPISAARSVRQRAGADDWPARSTRRRPNRDRTVS
jgi:hypothetical protein